MRTYSDGAICLWICYRYVDTYNQGSTRPAQSFQSPPLPSVKHAALSSAKFFVPTPSSVGEQMMISNSTDSFQEASISEYQSTSTSTDITHSSIPPSTTIQRYPSMVNISHEKNGDISVPHARRTSSWGGSINNSFSSPKASEIKPLGDMLGFSPTAFIQSDASSTRMLPPNGGTFGDDLHEVEL